MRFSKSFPTYFYTIPLRIPVNDDNKAREVLNNAIIDFLNEYDFVFVGYSDFSLSFNDNKTYAYFNFNTKLYIEGLHTFLTDGGIYLYCDSRCSVFPDLHYEIEHRLYNGIPFDDLLDKYPFLKIVKYSEYIQIYIVTKFYGNFSYVGQRYSDDTIEVEMSIYPYVMLSYKLPRRCKTAINELLLIRNLLGGG